MVTAIVNSPESPTRPAAYIDGLSVPPRAAGNALFKVAAFCVVVVAAVWAIDRFRAHEADRQLVSHIDSLTGQIAADERRMDDAIRAKRAVPGMTRTQVRMAKGEPLRVQRGETLPDVTREHGGVETWLYNVPGDPTHFVTFDLHGHVRYSTDMLAR